MKELQPIIWRWAKVIDNNDSDKKGKIKLRVLPEFNGIEDAKLPWCKPFINVGGGDSNGGSHQVPQVNEMVKVFILDKYWQQIEYLHGDYVENNYPYDSFLSKVSLMSELGNQTYPQPNFIQKFSDNSYTFRNTETGETGFFHNSGSYCIFDSSGNIILNSNTNLLKIKSATATLHTVLKDTLTIVKNIITAGSLIGNLGAPVVYTQVATDLPKIQQKLIELDNLLKD